MSNQHINETGLKVTKTYAKFIRQGLTAPDAVTKSAPELSTVVATRYSALRSPEVNETTGGLQEAMADSLKQACMEPLVSEWL